jgi:predicted NACHT family NTPase
MSLEDVSKVAKFGYTTSKKVIDTVDSFNDSAKGREKYAKNIQHKYGNLTLSGLNHRDRIPLGELFIDLNVCESFSSDEDFSEQSEKAGVNLVSEEESIEQKEKISELVPKILSNKDYRCVVILGTPGSGKSTLARGLALKWANDRSNENWIQSVLEEELPDFLKSKNGKFPLFIDLEEYARSKFFSEGFWKFWQHGPGTSFKRQFEKIEKSLRDSTRLLIFEGLDRVSPLQYLDVLNKIVEFSEYYLGARIIVTSRSVGYNPDRLENAEFKHFTIQDLDEAQIENFIDKFCNFLTIESTGKGKNNKNPTHPILCHGCEIGRFTNMNGCEHKQCNQSQNITARNQIY